jgi:phage terminase large subunit-like protein
MCGACRVVRFFRNVLFAPVGFTLLAWQEQALRGIYGPVDPETGRRKIKRAYVSVSKKQGKSSWVGGIPLYHLTMDDVDHPEAYGAAAAKDQAAIVWRAAARLAEANPLLRQRLKVIPSTRRIIRPGRRRLLHRALGGRGPAGRHRAQRCSDR